MDTQKRNDRLLLALDTEQALKMFSTRRSGTKRRRERYENPVCSFLSLSLSLSFSLNTRFDILIESRLKVTKKLEPCEPIPRRFDEKAS